MQIAKAGGEKIDFKDVYGKTLTFVSVSVFANEAVFYTKFDDQLALRFDDTKQMKLYDTINSYVSHMWRETQHPFPVTIQFHKEENGDKNV